MGSCVSSSIHNHKTTSPTSSAAGSAALKLPMSSHDDENSNSNNPSNSIPPTPVKDKHHSPAAIFVEPASTNVVSLRNKSQVSPRTSFASSYRSYGNGSKDEAFYDTQGWLDSDCDDDFYSVNGDFTPSRGSTPVHNGLESSRFSKTFSPQVNRALFDGRPPRRSVSNRSRGSTPVHHRSNSAMSPLANGTISDGASPKLSSTTKKKKLADLFRESIRERAGERLFFGDYYENHSSPNNTHHHVLPPKSANRTPTSVSGTNSVSSSGKRTPNVKYVSEEKEKSIKAAQQCCFPRMVSSRSFRESKRASSPSMNVDDLKA